MAWTQAEEKKLIKLASQQKYFYTEIAEKLGKTPQVVRWKARQLDLPSTQRVLKDRFGKWNSKHSQHREAVMQYFLNHTAEECQKKFKLTLSEFKSLMTAAYRMPEYAHLRKDTRDHSAWTTEQLQFLLTHSGLQPRAWIGKRLKRGNDICMKEKLGSLGVSSKNLNGLTLTQFREAFGAEPEFYLETKAGPGRGGTPTYYKIIPWVVLNEWAKRRKLRCHPIMKKLIKTMALFQEWIFDGNALEQMQKILRKRD